MVAVALANTLFFSVPLGEARDKVALYLTVTMAPFAVLSPLVGPWLDRRRGAYRAGIAMAAVGRAALALLLSGRTQRLTLYPLAFGLLVLSRAHGVSRSALVPEVVPPGRQLMWGNAWLAVISVLGGALGAGVAVGTGALGGPDMSLAVAAVVFGCLVVAGLRLPSGVDEGGPSQDVDDYRRLLSTRLVAAGVAMAASRAAVGFLTFFMAFVLRTEGHSGTGFALVIAAAGLGGFVGSVVAPLLRALLRESLLLLVCLAVTAAVAVWAAGSFQLVSAAAVAAVAAFAAAVGRLAFDSLLQHDAPELVRGRTFARYETIFQLAWVGGGGLATVVPFGAAGGLMTIAAIALGGIVASVPGLFREPVQEALRLGEGPQEASSAPLVVAGEVSTHERGGGLRRWLMGSRDDR